MHSCLLCGRAIAVDERYFDGGYGRRAHVECVDDENAAREPGGEK
jgi:hypothetical protein